MRGCIMPKYILINKCSECRYLAPRFSGGYVLGSICRYNIDNTVEIHHPNIMYEDCPLDDFPKSIKEFLENKI